MGTRHKSNPSTPHLFRAPDGLWHCEGGPVFMIGYGYDWRGAWADWETVAMRRAASAAGGPLAFTLGAPRAVEHDHV